MIYFVRNQKKSKENHLQTENYIKKFLRRLAGAYKITATKTLKIKIHVSFINSHLKRLIQSLIVNMNAKRLISAMKTAMRRIKKNLMSKKKTKVKIMNNFTANKKT